MTDQYKEYAKIMKALSDETRIKVYHMLAGSESEMCACKILEDLNITQPTLSYHMKIMSDSGLVNYRREGVWTKYSINIDKLQVLYSMVNNLSQKQ